MKSIKKTLDDAKMITSFIYSSLKVVNLMKLFTRDRDLLSMNPLVRVLKIVDQDKKPTLSIIYEAMDRAKLAIKASNKNWKKY